jgi:steroid delta-isomerase-like uncharacterized protein
MSETETQNVATLERALTHFADPAARERYFDLYDPAIVLHGYAGVEPGLANAKSFYAGIWSAFPDARVNIEDVFTAADKVVCRFVMTGTHQGNFNGIPATGKPIALSGISILRFANGKCVERWSQADFLGLLAQLGALPGPL